MRIIIDECVDPRVKQLFPDHAVFTVHDRGWEALEDGPLLRLAEIEFDVLPTLDRNLEFQQNLKRLRIAIIVIRVAKNQLAQFQAIEQELRAAIDAARPGELIHVP